jgi:hypothetical protein
MFITPFSHNIQLYIIYIISHFINSHKKNSEFAITLHDQSNQSSGLVKRTNELPFYAAFNFIDWSKITSIAFSKYFTLPRSQS